MAETPIIVIGAGIGGLAAGMLLVARGEPVLILEKQSAPGGKMRLVRAGRAEIDGGPTVFTMRSIFDALFEAARLLKPGGRLVYATCSILERENHGMVEAFLSRHPGFVRVSAADILRSKGIALDCGEEMLLWPDTHGTDGFFAAVLIHHAVVQSFWQRFEDVTNLKRHRDANRLVKPGHSYKPVAILLIGQGVLVTLVVLHGGGIGQRTSGKHAAPDQQFLLNLQALVERHLAKQRLVQHVQRLNLGVEERDHGVDPVDAGRRTALGEVH